MGNANGKRDPSIDGGTQADPYLAALERSAVESGLDVSASETARAPANVEPTGLGASAIPNAAGGVVDPAVSSQTASTDAEPKKGKAPTASYEDWDPTTMGNFYGTGAGQSAPAAPAAAASTSVAITTETESFGFGDDENAYGSSSSAALAKKDATQQATPVVAVTASDTYGSSEPVKKPSVPVIAVQSDSEYGSPFAAKQAAKKASTLKPVEPAKPAPAVLAEAAVAVPGPVVAPVPTSASVSTPASTAAAAAASAPVSAPATAPVSKATSTSSLAPAVSIAAPLAVDPMLPPAPPRRASKEAEAANGTASKGSGAEPIYELPVALGHAAASNPLDIFEWFRTVDPRCLPSVRSPLWIHSTQLSRKETERIFLRFAMQSGMFLVRQRTSTDENASYALSVVVEDHVEHHIIDLNQDGYHVQGTVNLHTVYGARSIEDLINQLAAAQRPARPILAVCVPIVKTERFDIPNWLHGSISREEANARLFEDGKFVDGRFLVRFSAKQQTLAYVVSMIFDSKVFHHLLIPEKDEWTFNGMVCSGCRSLSDAITYLMKPTPGLPCPLLTYVPARPPYEIIKRDVPPPLPSDPRNRGSSFAVPRASIAPVPPPISAIPRQSSKDEATPSPMGSRKPSVDEAATAPPRHRLSTEAAIPLDAFGARGVPQMSRQSSGDVAIPPPAGARRTSLSVTPVAPPRRESLQAGLTPPPSPGVRKRSQSSSSPPPSPGTQKKEFENVYMDANALFYEIELLVRPDEVFELIRENEVLPPTFVRVATESPALVASPAAPLLAATAPASTPSPTSSTTRNATASGTRLKGDSLPKGIRLSLAAMPPLPANSSTVAAASVKPALTEADAEEESAYDLGEN